MQETSYDEIGRRKRVGVAQGSERHVLGAPWPDAVHRLNGEFERVQVVNAFKFDRAIGHTRGKLTNRCSFLAGDIQLPQIRLRQGLSTRKQANWLTGQRMQRLLTVRGHEFAHETCGLRDRYHLPKDRADGGFERVESLRHSSAGKFRVKRPQERRAGKRLRNALRTRVQIKHLPHALDGAQQIPAI